MIELCRMNSLTVDEVNSQEIWLVSNDERVVLSRREAKEARVGQQMELFVFLERGGQLRGTLKRPLAQAGEFALMTVREVGQHGAFLDWGMDKDLLAPFRLQPQRMEAGASYLVRVGLDREGRPFANARVDKLLEEEVTGLKEGDEVTVTLWQETDLGAKVIVNDRFLGLLYKEELGGRFPVGQRLSGYVKRIRDDGKLDVTLRKVGVEGVEDAKEVIMTALKKVGCLHVGDQSSPEEIRAILSMSKKTFKKAVGGLYKEGAILLADDGIRLNTK
jgi:predicted RNA-binding protein (virulence factor B family)